MANNKEAMKVRVRNDLSYHSGGSEKSVSYMEEVRKLGIEYAMKMIDLTPEGRDQSMGLTHLEEAQRCFIASIAKTGYEGID